MKTLVSSVFWLAALILFHGSTKVDAANYQENVVAMETEKPTTGEAELSLEMPMAKPIEMPSEIPLEIPLEMPIANAHGNSYGNAHGISWNLLHQRT